MSAMSEPAVGFTDAGSSVKLVRNAKGDVQLEIKIRVGDTDADVREAEAIARSVFDRLSNAYKMGGAS